jgi:hypothetical protein
MACISKRLDPMALFESYHSHQSPCKRAHMRRDSDYNSSSSCGNPAERQLSTGGCLMCRWLHIKPFSYIRTDWPLINPWALTPPACLQPDNDPDHAWKYWTSAKVHNLTWQTPLSPPDIQISMQMAGTSSGKGAGMRQGPRIPAGGSHRSKKKKKKSCEQ